MTLADKLRNQSMETENIETQIVNEVVDYFNDYLNSEKFEKYLEKICSYKDVQLIREQSIDIEFWRYISGCSTTHWRLGNQSWTNPENEDGINSWDYKGIELRLIQENIGNKLIKCTKDKLEEFGFDIKTVENKESWLKNFHKQIYFTW